MHDLSLAVSFPFWIGGGEELKPGDLGINILVYALTREGSLAWRLVSTE
ncbi:MAG: hypothetical protein WDA75_16310 [Candidatus Latescibacterota bacterium]|jgi:hypothetical protein